MAFCGCTCEPCPVPTQVMIAPNEDIATERFIDRDTYEGYIKRMVPYPVKITEARFLSRYRLHHRVASAFRSGRAFVAGDAAHVHSPVGECCS